MILLTSLYDNPERHKDNLQCLENNLRNEHIKKIIVLLESGKKPIIDSKIEYVEHERPTYADFFYFFEPNDINIIANSDIFFDDSIVMANKILDNQCFAITRHEWRSGTVKNFGGSKPEWSQDVWIFRNPPPHFERKYEKVIALNLLTNQHETIPFYLGVAGCDNHFAYLLSFDYNVKNPYKDIRSIHIHPTEERNYNMKYRIKGTNKGSFGKLQKVIPCRL